MGRAMQVLSIEADDAEMMEAHNQASAIFFV